MAMNVNPIKPKLCFIKDTEQIIGRDRQTLRRWWQQNKFPKPTLIANRLTWQTEVIEQWINKNVQGVQDDSQQ